MTYDEAFALVDPIPGHMHPPQLQWLWDTVMGLPERGIINPTILEIGCADGRSACMMGLALGSRGALEDGRVYTVDNRCGKIGAANKHVDRISKVRKSLRQNVVPICATSPSQLFRRPISMAFIDAHHMYPQVAADIGYCMALLEPGGILSGHDYGNTDFDVKESVDQLVFADKEAFPQQGVHHWIWWAVKA